MNEELHVLDTWKSYLLGALWTSLERDLEDEDILRHRGEE